MRRTARLLVPALLGLAAAGSLFLAGGVQAREVYRCTTAAGKVEFSDTPCGAAHLAAVVEARPNSLDNSAVREQLLRIENKALREEVAAGRPATALQAPAEPSRVDSPACRTAKRDAEAAATSIEQNKELIRTRRSAMHIACGVAEPDRTVTNVNVGRGTRDGRQAPDPRISGR